MKKKIAVVLSVFLLSTVYAQNFQDISINNNFSKYYFSPLGLETSPFHLSLAVDIPLAAVSVTMFTLGYALNPEQPVYTSKSPMNADEINAFDRWAMRPYSEAMDISSTVLTGLTMALPAVLFTTDSSDYLVWLVMYAETMLTAQGTKELTKKYVNRARPYMYFSDFPENEVKKGDWSNSFYSGHTTLSFAAATFISLTFCQYFPDNKLQPLVIAGSFTLATTTAALRMAGGCHFFTDVLTGAAMGAFIGAGVPLLHKINPKIKKSIYEASSGKIKDFNIAMLAGGVGVGLKY